MARGFITLAATVILNIGVLIVGSAGIALAQSRGTGGSGSMSSGSGASSFGGSTAGRGGTTGTGTFGSRSLGGSFQKPNRSFGGTRPGQGVDTSAGLLSGSERFIRANRQAGDFVGGDSRDSANPFSSQSGGFAAQSALSGLRTGQGNSSNRGNRQSEYGGYGAQGGGGLYGRSNQPLLRPTLRVEFAYTTPAVGTLHTTLTQRLNRSTTSLRVAGPVEVRIEERTAVLRGTIATEHDRDLAERLALLEPGISSVRNELTIATPTKAPPAAAAGADLPPPAKAR